MRDRCKQNFQKYLGCDCLPFAPSFSIPFTLIDVLSEDFLSFTVKNQAS